MTNSTTKPKAIEQLAQYDTWVCWQYEQDEKIDKPRKVPYNPITGHRAKPNDPGTWSSYEQALKVEADYDGLGFMFHPEINEMAGVDLDDCKVGIFSHSIEHLTDWAADIVEAMNSYTEVSPSGEGVKIFVKAEDLPPLKGINRDEIEIYNSGRYFTVTGHHLEGTPETIEECSEPFRKLHQRYDRSSSDNGSTTEVVGTAAGDQDVLNSMLAAANSEKYERLLAGDTSDYGGDDSRADIALVEGLHFHGADQDQIDRLFRASGLMRDKWDQKHNAAGDTYGAMTIARVLGFGVKDPTYGRDNGSGTNSSSPGQPQPKIRLTDLGNARRLVNAFGQDLRYVKRWDKWFIWDDTRWAEDETGSVERLAKKVPELIYLEGLKAGEDWREKIMKHGAKTESAGSISALIKLARSERPIAISHHDFDNEAMRLNCLNGTINLETGQLLPHRRQDLITKQIPIAYDPEAKCPLWLAFLDRVMAGDQDVIDFLQRALGYTLTGYIIEQCLFFKYGGGNNGKSVFSETVKELFGDYGQKAPTDMLMIRRNDTVPNDIARLPGARFVIVAEIQEGQKLAESLVKDLTGGDTLVGRFLHKEFFEFKPNFKLWMYGNHKPEITGTDEGIWRRINLIPFEVTIPKGERDPHLTEKLKAELPGILAWAVRGCLAWQDKGLQVPSKVARATSNYRAEMDVLSDFLDDCCVKNKLAQVRAGKLYTEYDKWCKENSERSLNRRKFSQRLVERGFEKEKKLQHIVWLGLGLAENDDQEPEQRDFAEI